MNHEAVKDKLLAFQDAELPEEERREIAAHLGSCEACRGVLKQWELIGAMLAGAVSAEPSRAFVGRVMNRLAALEEAQTARAPLLPFPRWFLPAIGYAFAFFLMFLAISHPPEARLAASGPRAAAVNTETVLLADIPQTSQWTFSAEPADLPNLVEVPKEEI